MSKKGKLIFYKYRHIFIAIFIIIIVIILDIIFENYTKNSIEKINGNIEKIYMIFNTKDDDAYNKNELEKLSKKAVEEWEKREKNLTCFIEHEEIEKINVKLNILNTEIRNEIWSNAKSTAEETKQLVKYLNEKHNLSLQNLF